MNHAPHRRHSFGIIPIFRDGDTLRVLVIEQERLGVTQWNFPKGTPEAGESPTETALRETKEEVGIAEIDLIPDFAHTEAYVFTEADTTEVHKQVTYFAGYVRSEAVVLQADEVRGSEWLSLKEALAKLTFDGPRRALSSLGERLRHEGASLDI